MQFSDANDHELLTYVDAVSRQGYGLTHAELQAFARKPAGYIGETLLSLRSLAGAETEIDTLVRRGWLHVSTRGHVVRITDLGRAVLRHLTEQEVADSGPAVLVAGPDDPLAYPRVMGRVGGYDDALLVDPYVSLEAVALIATQTRVSRILTSRKSGGSGRARITEVAALLGRLRISRLFEVRVNEAIHDRYVIPPTGAIEHLGSSLSGVGDGKLTVMTQIGSAPADLIRRHHEALWEAGEVVEPPAAEPPESGSSSESSPAVLGVEDKPRRPSPRRGAPSRR